MKNIFMNKQESEAVFNDYVTKRNCTSHRAETRDYSSMHRFRDAHIKRHLNTAITASKEYFGATDEEIREGLSHLHWPGTLCPTCYAM